MIVYPGIVDEVNPYQNFMVFSVQNHSINSQNRLPGCDSFWVCAVLFPTLGPGIFSKTCVKNGGQGSISKHAAWCALQGTHQRGWPLGWSKPPTRNARAFEKRHRVLNAMRVPTCLSTHGVSQISWSLLVRHGVNKKMWKTTTRCTDIACNFFAMIFLDSPSLCPFSMKYERNARAPNWILNSARVVPDDVKRTEHFLGMEIIFPEMSTWKFEPKLAINVTRRSSGKGPWMAVLSPNFHKFPLSFSRWKKGPWLFRDV